MTEICGRKILINIYETYLFYELIGQPFYIVKHGLLERQENEKNEEFDDNGYCAHIKINNTLDTDVGIYLGIYLCNTESMDLIRFFI